MVPFFSVCCSCYCFVVYILSFSLSILVECSIFPKKETYNLYVNLFSLSFSFCYYYFCIIIKQRKTRTKKRLYILTFNMFIFNSFYIHMTEGEKRTWCIMFVIINSSGWNYFLCTRSLSFVHSVKQVKSIVLSNLFSFQWGVRAFHNRKLSWHYVIYALHISSFFLFFRLWSILYWIVTNKHYICMYSH